MQTNICVREGVCVIVYVFTTSHALYIYIYIDRYRYRYRFWDLLKGINCGGWCMWRMQIFLPPEFNTAHNRIDLPSLTLAPKATYIVSSNRKASDASCLLAIFPGAPISRNLILQIYNLLGQMSFNIKNIRQYFM